MIELPEQFILIKEEAVMAENELMKEFEESGKFDTEQLNLIRDGIHIGLDVSTYARPEFDFAQMCKIKSQLEDESREDISIEVSEEVLKKLNLDETDITFSELMQKLEETGNYDECQLEELELGLEDELDIGVYINEKFTGRQMEIIRNAMLEGLEVSI